MTPAGRKKGSKNKHIGEPQTFAFWKETLKNPETVNAFLERGSKQQKETIKEILHYLKRFDKEYFDRINGEEILKDIQ